MSPWFALPLLALPAAWRLRRDVAATMTGAAMNALLFRSVKLELIFGAPAVTGRDRLRASLTALPDGTSEVEADLGPLRDRALGVELDRDVGAADQRRRNAALARAAARGRAAAPGRRR